MAGYYVYCLTFPNNKKYVGMTYDYEKRWDNGKGYHGSPFYEEIKKFGWHNIKREILYSNLSVEEANEMEKLVIKTLKRKIQKRDTTSQEEAVMLEGIRKKRKKK